MPQELPTFASLQPRCLNRARDPYWRMEVPVIGTEHIPKTERDLILGWDANAPQVLAAGADHWTLIFMLFEAPDQVLGPYTAGLPILAGLLAKFQEKGFEYLRLDPSGIVFSDLPVFE